MLHRKITASVLLEEQLITGRSKCGRFTGLAEAAKVENSVMRGGGRVHQISSKCGTGKMGQAKAAIIKYMTAERGWMGSGEIAEAVGVDVISIQAIRKVLHMLVNDGPLEMRTVPCGSGRRGEWRRKEGGE